MKKNIHAKLFICLTLGFVFVFLGCSGKKTMAEDNSDKTVIVNNQNFPNKMLPIPMSTTPTNVKHSNNKKLDLDPKALKKVNDAFSAIIQNDDKKAKLFFGRSYKYMPEFIQFAFDLRFKNFSHAKDLTSKMPYLNEENVFWQNLVQAKPPVISKYLCEEFKKISFAIPQAQVSEIEMPWYQDIQEMMDELYSKEMSKTVRKNTVLDEVFSKIQYKNNNGETLPLNEESQKDLLQDSFFDKIRNAQRKDVNHWLDTYKTPLSAWTYQRLLNPQLAFQFYESLMATTQIEAHKKSHFERRLRGIIKDMRVETITMRNLANKTINDQNDMKTSQAVQNFLTRYPVLTVFLNLESTLANCGLKNN